MFRKEHRKSLVVANPSGIAVSEIGEVRRQQGEQAVVGKLSLQRLKPYFLQDHIPVRIAKYLLMDPVTARVAGILQAKRGDSRLERPVLERAMTFLFGEEITATRHDETHVTGAGLVHAWEIDFVQNTVA